MNSGPHRIRPPPSQATADPSRTITPAATWAALPSACPAPTRGPMVGPRRSSGAARCRHASPRSVIDPQHRNLIRRAAGRCRSEPAAELRTDSLDSRSDPFRAPIAPVRMAVGPAHGADGPAHGAPRAPVGAAPSSPERLEQAVEADLGVARRRSVPIARARLETRAWGPGRAERGARPQGVPGGAVAALVGGLTLAAATSGPGSRRDEVAHGLAVERRGFRMMGMGGRRRVPPAGRA